MESLFIIGLVVIFVFIVKPYADQWRNMKKQVKDLEERVDVLERGHGKQKETVIYENHED